MEFNLADLFEAAVDAYPEREYLVADGKRRTYAEMEARANQLAHHLAGQGIGPGFLPPKWIEGVRNHTVRAWD